MTTITWLATTRRRAPKLGALISVVLAAGLAGPTDSATAAPAATKTALLAWGKNAFGQLGNGKTADSDLPVTVKLPSGVKPVQVRGGTNFTVALTTGGVYAWGDNRGGQLGIGRTGAKSILSSHVPVLVHLPRQVINNIAQVRAGSSFALALTSTGHVWAWGDGLAGDLGDGKTSDALVPVQVATPAKIVAISAGCLHSLALTAGGEVLAWGNNKYGQLGDDGTDASDVPVRVELPRDFKAVAVAAGCSHSLALGADGEIFAWGDNLDGQVGDGQPNMDNILPIEIFPQISGPPIGKVVQIVGACDHTLALTSNGTVLAWGNDVEGELGVTPIGLASRPIRVPMLDGKQVTSLEASCFTSYAKTKSGQELSWGEANSGQLGDGSFDNAFLPVAVHLPTGDKATAIGAGPAGEAGYAIVSTS